MSDDLDAVRCTAAEAYGKGDFQSAIGHQSAVINILGPNGRAAVKDQVRLAAYLSAMTNYVAALTHAERHLPVDPGV